MDRLRDDLEPYSATHSNLESLVSEKSIDKHVEAVGVNDIPRRKSKLVREIRNQQLAPQELTELPSESHKANSKDLALDTEKGQDPYQASI